MKFLDNLEKRFGFLAVPNVILTLIIAQLVIYAAILIGQVEFVSLLLVPKAVLAGEWWRIFSFVLAPPRVPETLFQGLFLAFFWYILWMMSTSLESIWGAFRFNFFLLSGIVFTIVGSFLGQFISPGSLIVVSPYFLYLSVFFAFATLNPNIQFLIFFVVPVKVKWLAWFMGVMTLLSLFSTPTMGERLAIVTPLINYLLFFRDAMTHSVKSRKRRAQLDKERRAVAESAMHTCSVCGDTDRTHPEKVFRYKVVDGDAVCMCQSCREQ